MNDYYTNLPRKRMASGALFFNKDKELLILKPTYKNHWIIPGGVVDKDESPRDACVREVKEETGLDKEISRMLCVDYKEDDGKGENVVFVFDGGSLTDDEIGKIELPEEEIAEFKFLPQEEALELFSNSQQKRFKSVFEYWDAGKGIYLENGLAVI